MDKSDQSKFIKRFAGRFAKGLEQTSVSVSRPWPSAKQMKPVQGLLGAGRNRRGHAERWAHDYGVDAELPSDPVCARNESLAVGAVTKRRITRSASKRMKLMTLR